MDTQRKKGVLDICVLAVLARGASYGYKIVGDVSQCIEISESTLYPILRRLEASGCVTTYRQAHNGRTRKYYALTAAGMEKIREFLLEWKEMQKIYRFIEQNSREEEKNEAGRIFGKTDAGAGLHDGGGTPQCAGIL